MFFPAVPQDCSAPVVGGMHPHDEEDEAEVDGFVEILQIHQCLRNEFTSLARLVERARGDVHLRQDALQHFNALKAIYDSHSQVEDSIIFPELVSAHSLDEQVCAELDRQHAGQKHMFARLEQLLVRWCEGSSSSSQDQEVVDLADKLRASVCLHLNLEEEEVLPSLGSIRHHQSSLLLGRVIGERSQDLMRLILRMLERNLPPTSYGKVMRDFSHSTSKTRFGAWQQEQQQQVQVAATTSTTTTHLPLPPGAPRWQTLNSLDQVVPGCPHYQRGLLLFFDCCQRFFPCAKCHDGAPSTPQHAAQFTSKQVWCQQCEHVQVVSSQHQAERCQHCHAKFAAHACLACQVWENEASIYHCPYCNQCRRGKGLGIDFHHCMKCNRCMSTSLRSHKCVEESSCMICLQDLDEGTNYLSRRCGHVMHQQCFRQHLQYDFRCPSCRCSLITMDQTWAKLDAMVVGSAARGAVARTTAVAQFTRCNDCGQNKVPVAGPMRPFVERGLVALKVGERCQACGSYNTLC